MAVAIIVVIFLAAMFLMGFATRKYAANAQDYLVGGREMGTSITGMGILATGFAGTSIALAPAYVLMYGYWGGIAYSMTFNLIGYVVYGFLFMKTIRRSGAYTLPEWLSMRFGERTRRVLSISGFIGIVAITANNCLAMANVLTGFFGWNLYVTTAVSVVTFLGFTYLSGMWGVSLTDFVQAIIGCVGVPLLFLGSMEAFGTLPEAAATWSSAWGADSMFTGISGMHLPGWSLIYPSVLTLIINMGLFLVWGGQHYWIRAAAVRSEKAGRNGFVIGGLILFVITLVIAMIGYYAGAYNGDMFTLTGGTVPPNAAYGATIASFSPAIGAFLVVFALAASLSTCSSTLLGAVAVASKDIYPAFINKNPSDAQTKRAAKLSVVLVCVATWILTYFPGGTTFLAAFATAWMGPAGVLFVVGFLWKRATPKAAEISAWTALIAMSAWVALDLTQVQLGGKPISGYFHLSIVGLVSVLVPLIVGSFLTEPKYYGAEEWKRRQYAHKF